MQVRDVMHHGAVSVEEEMPLPELARRMRDQDVGALPVTAGGRVVGIVTDRDIVCRGLAESRDPVNMTAKDVMSRNLVCCSADDDVEVALSAMKLHRIRRLPVVNDDAGVVGILSLGDIVGPLGKDASSELLQAVSAHHP
jgi:CBS domain-containing protein